MSETVPLPMGIHLHPRIAHTSRGAVQYDLTEPNGPAVLCSHGGLGGMDQARVMLAWLPPGHYQFISPSRPGYLDTPLESGRTIEEQADLFAALLDDLDIERAFVVSASAGGPPAYSFVLRHPDRVLAHLAIDSVTGPYDIPKTAGPIAQAMFTTSLGQKFVRMIGEKKPEWFLDQLLASEAYFTKAQQAAHKAHILSTPEAMEFLRGFVNTMSPYTPRKPGTDNDLAQYREQPRLPLAETARPTLVVHGTHDADVKFYDGVYAYESIPGAERHWIEEGSHLGFWFNPDAERAQDVARDFFRRHRP